jgi:Mn-dependent DtxR family transcriptional regulator
MSAALRQKTKDLIELAVDESTTDKERLSAAMKAIALIRKHDLLSSPLDMLGGDNETVQAAKSIFETLADPKLTKNLKKVADRFRRR